MSNNSSDFIIYYALSFPSFNHMEVVEQHRNIEFLALHATHRVSTVFINF